MKYRVLSIVILGSLVSAASLARAQTTPAPAEPSPSVPKVEGSFIGDDNDISGAEEFIRHCSVCHGLDAKGKGALASSLKKPPADLTQIAKRTGGHFPFSKVARIIRDGGDIASHGSSDMPAWGEVFRDHVDPIMARALIFELTLYLETLQAK